MQLLYTINSPYARKARVVALEKQLNLTLKEMVLADADCPIHLHNPLGKVPTLVLDDNQALYDSRVIVEYLDDLSPTMPLIATDKGLKINIRRWEALADGVCDAAVAVMLEERKPVEQQSPEFIDKHMRKLMQGFTTMDADLFKKKWCVNETFSLADIALGCTLGYVELRFKHLRWGDNTWQDQFPNLAKHYGVLIKRPSFKQTMPVA
jgi:glutathione S-transferase